MQAMATSLTKSDFPNICRLCLARKTSMLSILTQDINRLYYCTGLKLGNNDNLPSLICAECKEQVHTSFNFKLVCVNSDQILHQILSRDDSGGEHYISESNGGNSDSCSVIADDEVKLEHNFELTLTKNSDETADPKIPPCVSEDITDPDVKEESVPSPPSGGSDFDWSETDDKPLTLRRNTKPRRGVRNTRSKRVIREEQPKEGFVKCEVCAKLTKQRTYEQHLRRHEKPIKYKCDLCAKAYRQPCELATHKTRAHKSQGSITCQVCNKVFQLQAQLDFHLRSHFKKKYACDVCNKVFLKSTMLARHREIHDKERRKFCCTQCDASFLQEISLKKHIANRHTDKPIEKKICNICGLAVVNLRPHTLLKHTTGPQFKCEQCGRAFLYRSQWVNHIREKHEGVPKPRKALCITCGKSFPSQGYLRKHLSTHSEDRNFKCHLCPKRYKKADHLKVHLRVHAGYRPHVCTYCTKAFHTSTILKNHIRTHTGERPFSCYICGRAFGHKGALITHMKIHN